jgi:hypothetical protein
VLRGTTYVNGKSVPNDHKIYKNIPKCHKKHISIGQNIANSQKAYKHFPIQGSPKYTYLNWDFGDENIPYIWQSCI